MQDTSIQHTHKHSDDSWQYVANTYSNALALRLTVYHESNHFLLFLGGYVTYHCRFMGCKSPWCGFLIAATDSCDNMWPSFQNSIVILYSQPVSCSQLVESQRLIRVTCARSSQEGSDEQVTRKTEMKYITFILTHPGIPLKISVVWKHLISWLSVKEEKKCNYVHGCSAFIFKSN